VDVGDLKIRGLRLIAPLPGSTDPAGYLVMTVVNAGTRSDQFVRAVVNSDGRVAAAGATTADPHGSVRIGTQQPSGISPALPVTGLQQPLRAGAVADVSLYFADAGQTSVEVPVDHFSLAAPSPS
jgi:copper(I)-binding protein